MFLNNEQKQLLCEALVEKGLHSNQIEMSENDSCILFRHRIEPGYSFQVKKTIHDAEFADVFCNPHTYLPHLYEGCNTFNECLTLAKVWAEVVFYKLQGKNFFSKIFISHSSKDNGILNKFVNLILKQACGYEDENIVYTSSQSTGAEPGDSIPLFIKESLNTSDLVLFIISENYKKSEACMNEMGAAWALDKKTIPILFPNLSFTEVGWLQTFNKAIRINESESLDTLFQMLNRGDINTINWNKIKNEFLEQFSQK